MPHKYNADRRHHIPRPKRRVTNWSEYNEALQQALSQGLKVAPRQPGKEDLLWSRHAWSKSGPQRADATSLSLIPARLFASGTHLSGQVVEMENAAVIACHCQAMSVFVAAQE
jgi:hypothetical protein